MSTITTLQANTNGSDSRTAINANFSALNTDKAELVSPTFTGSPVLPTGTTAVTQAANDNSTKLATTAYADAQVSSVFKNGIASKNLADASTSQTIAHGLGRVPKMVRFSAHHTSASGTGILSMNGCYNGTTNSCVGNAHGTSSGTYQQYNSSVYGIGLGDVNVPADDGQTGVVTFDATNITITWTKNNSPTGTVSFMWEAQG